MNKSFLVRLTKSLGAIERDGLKKHERVLESPQGTMIVVDGKKVLNFCANNYLGLSNDPDVKKAAVAALDRWGYGLSSVRFICGTQAQHRELEKTIADFFSKDDAILYSSCFDANGGVFETLLDESDVILSDALNHASIIDGIRLAKATVVRYGHNDMEDLKKALSLNRDKRTRLIVTDGVFSMDGEVARLQQICDLADEYDAIVMVDDSHGTGVIGAAGRGSPDVTGTLGRIDILTSTLGKALGGASGGFVTGHQPIIDLLRQRSRPYLFSNSLAPMIVAASLYVLQNFDRFLPRLQQLQHNTDSFRSRLTAAGFEVRPGNHPIVPVMLYDARIAQHMADGLLRHGIYAVGFWYPVVPKDQARIRIQLSAAHQPRDLDRALQAFVSVRTDLDMPASSV